MIGNLGSGRKEDPKMDALSKMKVHADLIKKRFKNQHPFSSTKIKQIKALQIHENKMASRRNQSQAIKVVDNDVQAIMQNDNELDYSLGSHGKTMKSEQEPNLHIDNNKYNEMREDTMLKQNNLEKALFNLRNHKTINFYKKISGKQQITSAEIISRLTQPEQISSINQTSISKNQDSTTFNQQLVVDNLKHQNVNH